MAIANWPSRKQDMKHIGSRATHGGDAYSDWDYLLEGPAEVAAVETAVHEGLVWHSVRKGRLAIVTTVDTAGRMTDFTGPADWPWPAAPQGAAGLCAEFWVLAFKHLKALHRGQHLLLDVGMELSCGLLRDLFVLRTCGTTDYKNFFAYSQLPLDHAPGLDALFAVIGLPTRTPAERREKLEALCAYAAAAGSVNDRQTWGVWKERMARAAQHTPEVRP
jgi:hypothetical protein